MISEYAIKGKKFPQKVFSIREICLWNPYSNLPVSLIEKNTLEMLTGEEPVLYRYIPFVSLGEEHGMVQAVILDSLYIKKEKKEIAIQPAVFAIVEEKFLKDSTYRIILNGRLW